MRRPIIAGVLTALLVLLCGSPAQRILCRHIDGTKQVEAGGHDCCAPALGGPAIDRDAIVAGETEACPGCTDTLISADLVLRQAPGSKIFTPPTASPAILTAAAAPAAHSGLSFARARATGRHPALTRSIPLLI